MPKLVVGILVFDSYETLDVHGPVEFFGVPNAQVRSCSPPSKIGKQQIVKQNKRQSRVRVCRSTLSW